MGAPRLILAGPPGSGKGTQGQRLRELGYLHVSSGEMLRAEIAANTPRGRAVAPLMAAGALVADDIMFEIVDSFLHRHEADALVLDGYPRNLRQARRLGVNAVSAAFFLRIPDELLLRRIRDRVIGADGTIYDLQWSPPPPGAAVVRRDDDDAVTLQRRLAVYHEEQDALWDFYERAGRGYVLDAARSVDEVHAELLDLLRRLGLPASRARSAS